MLIYLIDYTIWKKLRLIIIAFKYSPENKRDLINQIKAQNITNYKFPQLGKLLFIIYNLIININII
jgi:hypothetical protein